MSRNDNEGLIGNKTWTEKCTIVQSFIDMQDVYNVRYRRSIGWFGRAKEFLFGNRRYVEQAEAFKGFLDKLQMFSLEELKKTRSETESSTKVGF